MFLNRLSMLELSVDHLSAKTRAWLRKPGTAERFDALRLGDQSLIPSRILSASVNLDAMEAPPDLMLCLHFAAMNDLGHVLFSTSDALQEGLPSYCRVEASAPLGAEVEPQPIATWPGLIADEGIAPAVIAWRDSVSGEGFVITGLDPKHFGKINCRIEPDGQVLDDDDYAVRGGVWLTLGHASIRVSEPAIAPGTVRVTVMPKGMEDTGAVLAHVCVQQSELEREIMRHEEELRLASAPSGT